MGREQPRGLGMLIWEKADSAWKLPSQRDFSPPGGGPQTESAIIPSHCCSIPAIVTVIVAVLVEHLISLAPSGIDRYRPSLSRASQGRWRAQVS